MSELARRPAEQQPSAFIRRKLEGGATRVALYVLGLDGLRTLVDTYPASLGYEELVDAIEERAARHAALAATVCNFAVEAVDGDKHTMGFETFRVSADARGAAAQVYSEPANEGGLLAQLMRHNEAAMRMALANSGSMWERMTDQLKRADTRAQQADETRLQVFQLLEDLVSAKHQRDLETLEATNRAELKAKVAESLTKLVPVGFDALMGRTPKGAAATSAHLARELFNSLRPEQFQQLLSVLDMEQQAMVMRAMRTLAAQEETKEESGATH